MATLITDSITVTNNTDEGYRVWVKHIRDTLLAVNPEMLTLANDTGQVDVDTVIRPTVGAANPPFNVFLYDDGMSDPFYIRLRYEIYGSATRLGGLFITLAKTTDGAGGMADGDIIANLRSPSISNTQSFIGESYVSVGKGYISMVLLRMTATTNAYSQLSISISRTVDDAGDPTLDGVCAILPTQDTGGGFESRSSGGIRFYATAGFTVNPMNLSSWAVRGKTVPMPVYAVVAGEIRVNPAVVSVSRMDISRGTEFDVAMVGVTPRRYILAGMYYSGAMDMAMLWE